MKRKKPHIYRAVGQWWVAFPGMSGCHWPVFNLRRAMFGEAL
jgi:hypothetical protein